MAKVKPPSRLTGRANQLSLDLVQFALDLVGIADPSPVSDGLSGLISLRRGDWLGAGISGLSMIPYIGDLAKAGKIPKYARSITEAIGLASKNVDFARALRPALVQIGAGLDRLPIMSVPSAVQGQFMRMRTDIAQFLRNTRWIDELENPLKRQYHHYSKHAGIPAAGRQGTKMDLSPNESLALLRKAEFSEKAATNTVPSLLGFKDGKVYRFMRDATQRWHGYPTVEAPPTDVLRKWLGSGEITKPLYKKLLQLPQRAK